MDLTFHALLTHSISPAVGASARSAAEKHLVNAYLESLPLLLRAQESYGLMADFAVAMSVLPGDRRWDLAILEKFLLWSFIVIKKPLAALNNHDVQNFLRFCSDPPESWLSKCTARFIREFGVLKRNPEWRPFYNPLRSEGVRRIINRFFDFSSKSIGLVLCPPPHAKPLPRNECRCDQAELFCHDYLITLKQHTKGKVSLELGLFLFATSFYLNVPLRDCFSSFTMDCFDFSDRDNGWFKISTHQGFISSQIPEIYLEYFFRWRRISQQPPYPTPYETQPLFSRRTRKNTSVYLPKLGPNGARPTKALSSFHNGCARCRGSEMRQQSSTERSKKYRVKIVDKQEVFSAIDDLYRESIRHDLNVSATPVPLFLFKEGVAVRLPEKLIVNLMVSCNSAASREVCSAGASMFCSLVDKGTGYLKLRAFEKLILWSVLIIGKSPADLDASEVKQFYLYCLSPPPKWVNAKKQSRPSIGPFAGLTCPHLIDECHKITVIQLSLV